MTAPIYQVKAEFFSTLGHPARIRILEVLQDGERPVSELIPEVGIEASHLSQQLGVMRRAGIIQSARSGRTCTTRSATPSSSSCSKWPSASSRHRWPNPRSSSNRWKQPMTRAAATANRIQTSGAATGGAR